MSEMNIRRYAPEDRQAALALAPRLEIGVAEWRNPADVARAVTGWVVSSLDAHAAERRAVFVAVDGEQLVGLVTLAEQRHFTGEVDAYVGELAVSAGYERRGVGRLLMDAAENWARARGLRFVTLQTGAANETARAFYARCGYREEDVRLTKDLGACAG
jgi:aminoglycoside 6'-N-acetyltransferase I